MRSQGPKGVRVMAGLWRFMDACLRVQNKGERRESCESSCAALLCLSACCNVQTITCLVLVKLCAQNHLVKMVKMFALVLLSANSDHQFEQLPHPSWDHFFYRDLAFYSAPYPRFGDLSHRNAVSLPGIGPGSCQPKSGILTTKPQRHLY